MNGDPLDTRILFVTTGHDRIDDETPTGLWLEELAVPHDAFVDQGYSVAVASPPGGIVPIDPRSDDESRAEEFAAARAAVLDSLRLADVDPDAYDALFLPGGHGTMFDFPGNPDLARVVESFVRGGKPVAAVCHGPAAFVGVEIADRPLVAGLRMTAFTDAEEREVGLADAMPFLLESRLRELGAEFVAAEPWSDHVEEDRGIVTGQNPQSSGSTARALVRAIQAAKTAGVGGRP